VKYLCTAVFWLVFLVFGPLEFLAGVLLLLVTLPFDPNRRAIHALICRWTFLYIRIFPSWRIQVTGRELLPEGPAVLVANHQSMADVVAVMGLKHPFKFVSKASLFNLPLVGWMMRMARYVSLERGRPRSTQRMMEACRRWLWRGVPVLLFPEGTYGTRGRMLPFKRGAFLLAIEEKVPLVPVALTGTTELVEGDGPWLSPRANIRITVLPPIPPAELGEDPDALSQLVRARLEAALAANHNSTAKQPSKKD
jgi:1-acyl-sn-glycerol-3-phosphate acyltransferase